ncbi:adenylyl-sulfate kinase [Endozoicomonas euniceicola]|uniref:Adenylyl-sulfate kinase n=1 Tax=Endozoicomonas euniceicola TaxID=1234143 RepID=A0ABY6H339_9GAMM|nr:adenylyl-sulfate kinase [Endozoicomonas euniceicola]UYM18544.1 adenylyl-sulfate kinase [Endozoicomonas euniceicola]
MENIVWHPHKVSKEARSEQKSQKPCLLWFTGLSGSGKSTVANAVDEMLHEQGYHTYVLDGDNVRHRLNKDLSFSDEDRVENIRRIGEVSNLFVDSGLIVLSAFISPFAAERRMVRDMLPEGEFIEVFVNTPIEVCEQRDPKGLYQKARAGQIKNFTGIDSAYEVPENPEVVINTAELTLRECAQKVIDYLANRGLLQNAEMNAKTA